MTLPSHKKKAVLTGIFSTKRKMPQSCFELRHHQMLYMKLDFSLLWLFPAHTLLLYTMKSTSNFHKGVVYKIKLSNICYPSVIYLLIFMYCKKHNNERYLKKQAHSLQKPAFYNTLGQFTRNYTQTVKRAADNKRRYAPGWVHSTCLLRGFPKGAAPHLAHDFAEQSVVCYTLCRRCPENTVAAGEGKGI